MPKIKIIQTTSTRTDGVVGVVVQITVDVVDESTGAVLATATGDSTRESSTTRPGTWRWVAPSPTRVAETALQRLRDLVTVVEDEMRRQYPGIRSLET